MVVLKLRTASKMEKYLIVSLVGAALILHVRGESCQPLCQKDVESVLGLKGTSRITESYLPSLATPCESMASHREQIMEKTRKFQIVYINAGLTNLCQHSTTDLARGLMMNEHKQSALLKARCFKHSKTTSSSFVFSLSPTSR